MNRTIEIIIGATIAICILIFLLFLNSCSSPAGKVAGYVADGYAHDHWLKPLERRLDTLHHHVLENRKSVDRLNYQLLNILNRLPEIKKKEIVYRMNE